MKKLSILAASSALFFAACGGSSATDPDDVSSSNTTTANGTDYSAEADYSVDTYAMLPKCNEKKEGQTGYVTGTSKLYVCEDGEWVVTQKPSRPNSSASEDKPGFGPIPPSSESSGANAGGYDPSTGILTDSRDGQKYKTTKIGEQVWMAENLNYAYLQPTDELDSSSFCYDNDPANCQKNGRLYMWSAAMDSAGVLMNDAKGKGCGVGVKCDAEGTVQGICPKGWHLPSREEFDKLLVNVNIAIDSIVKYKTQHMEALVEGIEDVENHLRDHSWKNGFDTFGFSALPAGHYVFAHMKFFSLGREVDFWSSSESGESFAYELEIYDSRDRDELRLDHDTTEVYESGKYWSAYSIRCLKDVD